MAEYPPYTVTFTGTGVPTLVDKDGNPVKDEDGNPKPLETPGPHTFSFTSAGGKLTVSLSHRDKGEKKPELIIKFE
jgi:hypothetical protein